MSPTHLVLASASPRRRELLERLGLSFLTDAADLDESVLPGESPKTYVRRLATAKAERVAARHPGALTLAADTTVVLGTELLGKPRDTADALRMLSMLCGKAHWVYSGVAVAGTHHESDVVKTQVVFRSASPAELAWYVASQEPLDKAGAYAIQGLGAFLVERIDGSPTSVVGLPLTQTLALLARASFGLPWNLR